MDSDDHEHTREDAADELQVTTAAHFAPLASISLSLSRLLVLPKPSSYTLSPPCMLRPPPHFSSMSHLSLSAVVCPSKSSLRHITSFVPLQKPLFSHSRGSEDPTNSLALRRASVVWFRCDLRVHDNDALTTAHSDSLSVLPVYCFDPRDYGKSSSGFDKTGPYRATFIIQSVSDLRRSLQSRGSNLVVRVGKPETVIPELAKAVGAEAVYAHQEVSHAEVSAEEKIEQALNEEGIDVRYFWGSTLYHIDDLPFRLAEMPSSYSGFREKVKGLQVRKTINAIDHLKGLPTRGNVEVGDVPSFSDLGLSPYAATSLDGKSPVNDHPVGGETEALKRLNKFVAECQTPPNKEGNGQINIYGASFSCKISPWLALGCLSPRFVFDELKKSSRRVLDASPLKNRAVKPHAGLNWLTYELQWRDFFRFITKKYSSSRKKVDDTPITACTGVLA